jgi:metal-responsive CopG/Arc/MetJ family transcriptional regulator
MRKSISDNTKKRRGRPVTTGMGTLIGVRLQRDLLSLIDEWRRGHEDLPSRPEAIRRLLEQAFKGKRKGRE